MRSVPSTCTRQSANTTCHSVLFQRDRIACHTTPNPTAVHGNILSDGQFIELFDTDLVTIDQEKRPQWL